jgi:transposase
MPNLRVFGTEISGNRQRNESLSPETRAAICACVAAGQKKADIARAFRIDRKTIDRTLKRFSERNDFESRPRTGRPKALDARGERYLVRLARQFAKVPWRALLHLDGGRVSIRTARRILQRHHLRKWRAKRRPKLTAMHAARRRAFCRFWEGREAELTSVCDSC